MPVIEYEGLKFELDDEDYLVNFENWNEKVACALAEREGVSKECPLTNERMDILKFMRDFYKKNNAFPILSIVCKNVHQPKNCITEQFMEPLKAWKIAGLPKPAGIMAYLLSGFSK